MSGKRAIEDILSCDTAESEVEDITEVLKQRNSTIKNISSYKRASFLREEKIQAEMKDSMYF